MYPREKMPVEDIFSLGYNIKYMEHFYNYMLPFYKMFAFTFTNGYCKIIYKYRGYGFY